MILRLNHRLAAALLLSAAQVGAWAQGIYETPGPWIDDASRRFELEARAGTYTVMTMAYGACQRVCSTSVRRIHELHGLAAAHNVTLNFVVFGLDPSEDRPQDWATYRQQNRLDHANLDFLSGPPNAVSRMAARLGIRYWKYGEHTMHDFRIVLVSPAGKVVRSVNHFDDDLSVLLP
jgi:cytochrome oxidase Cu insertion factor (SCO1/SenC/PrrC family)